MLPDNRPLPVKIFASRKVWVALSGVALSGVTILGLDPETWTPLISAIVVLATAVIASIGYEDGQEKSAGSPAAGANRQSPTANDSADAAHHTLNANLIIAATAIALLAAVSGCVGTTPAARWAQQRQVLTSANNVFIEQAELGHLSDEQIVAIGRGLQVASAHLDHAAQQLPEGGSDFESLLRRADHLLQLIQEQLKQAATGQREQTNGQDRNLPGDDHDRPGADRQRAPGRATGQPVGRHHAPAVVGDRGGWTPQRSAA